MMSQSVSALLDTTHALIAVVEEESELLALQGAGAATRELADAKARLAARMEQQIACLNRENPRWHDALDPADRQILTAAYEDLHKASVVNSDILQRQIELSSEMLAAVGLEMERLTGHGSKTYGSKGVVRAARGRSPLSVNTKL